MTTRLYRIKHLEISGAYVVEYQEGRYGRWVISPVFYDSAEDAQTYIDKCRQERVGETQ